MRKFRTVTAAVLGVGSMLAFAAAPAQAAYPVTTFPTLTDPYFGSASVTVTWYNRSVGISGTVNDFDGGDGFVTQICVWGFTGTNATGADYSSEGGACRGVDGGSKGFGYTIDASGVAGGLRSVQIALQTVASSGSLHTAEIRTRNRPAA